MTSNHLNLCRPLLVCLQSFPAWGSLPMSRLFTDCIVHKSTYTCGGHTHVTMTMYTRHVNKQVTGHANAHWRLWKFAAWRDVCRGLTVLNQLTFKTQEISYKVWASNFSWKIIRVRPHWACILGWGQLPGATACFGSSEVCQGPQGAVSAAICHCFPHLTWHLQGHELVTFPSESSPTFMVPTFTPTMTWPKPASQCFCSPNLFPLISNSYWTSPEKTLLIDPWRDSLLKHPPKQRWNDG